MKGVLADTGPLYAAVDPDDALHTRSRRELQRLVRERLAIIVPYPVLFETYTLVLHRLGIPAAWRWLEEIRSGASLLNLEVEDFGVACRRVTGFPDQSITLTDATVAVIAHRTRLPVWTFDHHFDALGSTVWR